MVGSLELTWKAHLLHTSVFETHGNAPHEHGVRLLECQSNPPPRRLVASAFRPRFTPGFDLRNPRAIPVLVGI